MAVMPRHGALATLAPRSRDGGETCGVKVAFLTWPGQRAIGEIADLGNWRTGSEALCDNPRNDTLNGGRACRIAFHMHLGWHGGVAVLSWMGARLWT